MVHTGSVYGCLRHIGYVCVQSQHTGSVYGCLRHIGYVCVQSQQTGSVYGCLRHIGYVCVQSHQEKQQQLYSDLQVVVRTTQMQVDKLQLELDTVTRERVSSRLTLYCLLNCAVRA